MMKPQLPITQHKRFVPYDTHPNFFFAKEDNFESSEFVARCSWFVPPGFSIIRGAALKGA